MTERRVVYLDPPWAIGPTGEVDSSLASIERSVFDDAISIEFCPATQGRYISEGPVFEEAIRSADALVINRHQVSADLLDLAGDRLRVVGRQGVGYDNLNVPLLAARGIAGVYVPDYCIDEVAAHTVSLILALERRLIPQHVALTSGEFNVFGGGVPRRLSRLTVGIIGFGRIGRAVAARLRTFYGRIVAYDPYVSTDVMESYGVVGRPFKALCTESDVVTLHCLLTNETEGLVDEAAFAAMRPSTYVVNASRGAVISVKALRSALEEGRIAGAGIDVFHPENPHDDDDWRAVLEQPSVLATSHRAFLSEESLTSQRLRIAEAVRQTLNGVAPAVGVLTWPSG